MKTNKEKIKDDIAFLKARNKKALEEIKERKEVIKSLQKKLKGVTTQ